MALTPKQEAFARAYVETGSPSEAYRKAYNAEKMSPEAVKVEGSRLCDHPNVSLLIAKLREEAFKRHRLTVDDLLNELEEARMAAYNQEKPQAAAMVAASMGKAKLLGLEAPTKTELTGPNGEPLNLMPTRIELIAPTPDE